MVLTHLSGVGGSFNRGMMADYSASADDIDQDTLKAVSQKIMRNYPVNNDENFLKFARLLK